MVFKAWVKGYLIFIVVIFISILLLINIYLIYKNNTVIQRQKAIQEEAEKIKVSTLDIIRNIHLLDLGLRGYFLVPNKQFYSSISASFDDKDKIFDALEKPLLAQHYTMHKFYALKDSVNAYFALIDEMKGLLNKNERTKFLRLLEEDRGFAVWKMYRNFSDDVNAFEDRIANDARIEYDQAFRNIYQLQILIFFILVPTLFYTAFHAKRTLAISERLRVSEENSNRTLAQQNEELERKVAERTYEIQTQNEEIAAQNEEILSHNETLVLQHQEIESQRSLLTEQYNKLKEANQIIESQNLIINQRNEALSVEVEKQNEDLKTTNNELIEQNNRLQQFTYIISHNLRAPLTRIIGLATIANMVKDKEETKDILSKVVRAANELDAVIKDLAFILEIQKLNTQILSEVNLGDILKKTIRMLKRELDKIGATLMVDLHEEIVLNSLPQYMESIFYNLISNAIKYRDPTRDLTINITSSSENAFVRIDVTDNGLGIDLEKYQDKIFVLYKRFHSHVEGRGLGLYLVKTQVSALGGRIEVSSKLNEGTTFRLFFKHKTDVRA